ncbi:TatD family hydrolase [Patescibacteria group bacterium]|nr:TatD family hydrolase [Patescibacteria group bacterium]
MLIDTHAHLNFEAFKNDWEEVARRAFDGGIVSIINVGSNLETSKKAVAIAGNNMFAAVGLHPIHADDEYFPQEIFSKLATNKKVVAIGETGIDLFYHKNNLKKQQQVFLKSISLANSVQIPIIVHCRNAKNEVFSILQKNMPQRGAVLHCYSEDWPFAQKLLKLGMHISFTANITQNSMVPGTLEAVKNIPLNKIMVETDSPYILPRIQKNKKIKRNEPLFVKEVAQKIAQIKGISFSEVAQQTTENAVRFFGLNK